MKALLLRGTGRGRQALWKIDEERIGILTVDFITPLSIPEYFGKIAAANSLSDVYAMGEEDRS